MILIYRVISNIIYPFLCIFIYYRKIIKKEDARRYKEKILISSFDVSRNYNKKLIWFHAASVGEFRSIIPIIKKISTEDNNFEFLITTTTLSSSNLAKIKLKEFKNIKHRFLPLDVDFLIEKFFELWRPNKIFLVDSEIWPNLILKSKKFNIPIAIINARLTSKTFNKWMLFPKVAKKIFSAFNLFICANSETKANLEKFNVENTHYIGNLKFIPEESEKKIENINENILKKNRIWVAASTHADEDVFCIKTHLTLKKKYEDLITVIAPRHINRSEKLRSLAKKYNLSVQILNKNEKILENIEIVIINYFGELDSFFKFSKSVFIGKSLMKKYKYKGGQNPIEAAKLNCKVYHGPYIYNFEEVYNILKKNNISKEVKDNNQLSDCLIIDLKDINKKNDIISNSINDLGKRIFNNTMLVVNNFLYHDFK